MVAKGSMVVDNLTHVVDLSNSLGILNIHLVDIQLVDLGNSLDVMNIQDWTLVDLGNSLDVVDIQNWTLVVAFQMVAFRMAFLMVVVTHVHMVALIHIHMVAFQTLVVVDMSTQTLVVDIWDSQELVAVPVVVVVNVQGEVTLPQDGSSATVVVTLAISQPSVVWLWQMWWTLATMHVKLWKKRRRSLPHPCLQLNLTVWRPGVTVGRRRIKNLLPADPSSPHFVLVAIKEW